ncbi:MAG: large subunit ribosomal protein L10 [Parcubacteria group bacterium Gr01-1014_18]|nr:MAG: large subunit ribosomal protein L10 [Parcubacteria group bacterium Greene0416_36]TSC81462.1 MAG: large subunit ribosomal protein L10 [Parcubacteria group bacterium Gr01-1014_18]TSC99060.1 MAG: large subunit ribosomal protein L10 [Parcubacteria group bacterium Greene1014_20]TSD07259.1 MAG: large subunit ribosomal protein L10 [Parcubacteria group bacterium Greene0714_2]
METLVTGFANSKSAIFANFMGLKVKDMIKLRRTCRKENVQCLVLKKSLLRKSLADAKLHPDFDTSVISKGVAVFLGADEVGPAKIIKEFAKDHPVVEFYGGVLNDPNMADKMLSIEAVKALASIPSRAELYGKLVGTLNAPMSGFVNVLSGNLRGLVNTLKAVADKKTA